MFYVRADAYADAFASVNVAAVARAFANANAIV